MSHCKHCGAPTIVTHDGGHRYQPPGGGLPANNAPDGDPKYDEGEYMEQTRILRKDR